MMRSQPEPNGVVTDVRYIGVSAFLKGCPVHQVELDDGTTWQYTGTTWPKVGERVNREFPLGESNPVTASGKEQ